MELNNNRLFSSAPYRQMEQKIAKKGNGAKPSCSTDQQTFTSLVNAQIKQAGEVSSGNLVQRNASVSSLDKAELNKELNEINNFLSQWGVLTQDGSGKFSVQPAVDMKSTSAAFSLPEGVLFRYGKGEDKSIRIEGADFLKGLDEIEIDGKMCRVICDLTQEEVQEFAQALSRSIQIQQILSRIKTDEFVSYRGVAPASIQPNRPPPQAAGGNGSLSLNAVGSRSMAASSFLEEGRRKERADEAHAKEKDEQSDQIKRDVLKKEILQQANKFTENTPLHSLNSEP